MAAAPASAKVARKRDDDSVSETDDETVDLRGKRKRPHVESAVAGWVAGAVGLAHMCSGGGLARGGGLAARPGRRATGVG